jgi:hypothetical protein
MKMFKPIVAIGVVLIAYSVVFAQNVKYDIAPNTDFAKYKTYKWRRADKGQYPDQVTDGILMGAIDSQLSAKGLTRTEKDTADLYVVYQMAITQDAELSTFTNQIQWQGVGTNSLPGFSGATTNSAMLVNKGWLLIDLFDVNQRKNVWQASATKTLGNSNDPKKMEPRARKAMTKVFKNYPPR